MFATHISAGERRQADARGQDSPRVEVEEVLYRFQSADNGAGPMWCHGSTCLVRVGQDVWASGLETLEGVKPLNNCRWLLFHRDQGGWRQVAADSVGRTREPCPLAVLADGRVFLSANPTLTDPGVYAGPARPDLRVFSARRREFPPETLLPEWDGQPKFTEHSYRSFAADGPRGELVLFQNIDYTHAEWAYRQRDGRWTAQGQLRWPFGADYEKPQPIRVCYPNVALRKRAVHFCGVSDITEPNPAWRAAKRAITGREWDYDFRRLFYTWSRDIRSASFAPWIELASRERTCGWVSPGDLWVAPDGAAHIVWTERAIDERLRAQFFPQARQSHEMNYGIVRDGAVVLRRTLERIDEGQPGPVPSLPRFHATTDGRLFVFYYASGKDVAGRPVAENRLMRLSRDGIAGAPVAVPLRHAFTSYFTATPRAGSPPSRYLDLLGTCVDSPGEIRYARIRVR
jgi:hypothetical protein